jgi:hypothetical protein
MARPLTGTRKEANGRFLAELPRARGATQRVRAIFDTVADREAWLEAALAAVSAGRPVPDPDPYRVGLADRASGPNADRSQSIPVFEELAHGWLHEYYGQLKNANAERARDVRIMVERHLIPTFAGRIPSDPKIARKRLIDFVRRMALEPEWEDATGAVPGVDRSRLVTIREAMVVCARSQATIRRALRAGQLPGAHRGDDGQWLIPACDLTSARLHGRSSATTALVANT